MAKSADAFRTISEVADWLGIQAHVLRFWESKFTQVRPVKRAGGRRYYRPNDMLLLGGIKQLLHEDGLTIKGVQKILREEGMNHVAALSQPLDELTQSLLDESPPTPFIDVPEEAQEETGVVLSFDKKTQPVEEQADTAAAPVDETAPVEDTATPDDASPADAPAVETVKDEAAQPAGAEGEAAPAVDNAAAPSQTAEEAGPEADVQPEIVAGVPESLTAEDAKDASPADAAAHVSQEESAEAQTEPPAQSAPQDVAAPEPAQTPAPASADEPEEAPEETESVEPAPVNEHITMVEPAPMARPEPVCEKVPLVADELEDQPETAESTDVSAEESPQPVVAAPEETSQPPQDVVEAGEDKTATDEPEQEESAPADDDNAALPAFLHRSVADADQPDISDNMPVDDAADDAVDDSVAAQDAPDADAGPEPAQAPPPPAPKPRVIDMPAFTPEHEISAAPAVLSAAFTCKQLNTTQARKIAPLLEKLTVLRDSMAATRPGARQTGAASPSND